MRLPATLLYNVKVAKTFLDFRCCLAMKWLIRLSDIMFDMPNDARCRQFADYVVDNFVANLLQTVTFRRHCGRMRLI